MSATLTTGGALLRAILDPANFADDGLRLVYADWLEENGQGERTEFIRVQVKLAKGKPCLSESASPRCFCRPECRRCALRRRERELLGNDVCKRCDWHRPLVHGGWEWEYRRGFVAEVACACADWLLLGPRLVRLQPLERVRLADRGPTQYGLQRLLHPPGPYWRWFMPSSPGGHPSEIPQALWDVYAALCRAEGESWDHPTEEAAWDALSRACLSWARSQEPA